MKRLDDCNKSTTEHDRSNRTLDRQFECPAGCAKHFILWAEIPPAEWSARDGTRYDIGNHLCQDHQCTYRNSLRMLRIYATEPHVAKQLERNEDEDQLPRAGGTRAA